MSLGDQREEILRRARLRRQRRLRGPDDQEVLAGDGAAIDELQALIMDQYRALSDSDREARRVEARARLDWNLTRRAPSPALPDAPPPRPARGRWANWPCLCGLAHHWNRQRCTLTGTPRAVCEVLAP